MGTALVGIYFGITCDFQDCHPERSANAKASRESADAAGI